MCGGTTSISSEIVKWRMPVSAYLKAGLFVVAAAAALFAAAGTVAIPGFWAYFAIFAVVMIVSFAALDPDLLRERAARSRRPFSRPVHDTLHNAGAHTECPTDLQDAHAFGPKPRMRAHRRRCARSHLKSGPSGAHSRESFLLWATALISTFGGHRS
jgi:hypothetical protein